MIHGSLLLCRQSIHADIATRIHMHTCIRTQGFGQSSNNFDDVLDLCHRLIKAREQREAQAAAEAKERKRVMNRVAFR